VSFVLLLNSGWGAKLPLQTVQPADLIDIQISASGLGIHFPKLDADIYVPALMAGFLGSKAWMAAENGRIGGNSASASKTAAARQNGRLGGRPKNCQMVKLREPASLNFKNDSKFNLSRVAPRGVEPHTKKINCSPASAKAEVSAYLWIRRFERDGLVVG